jgi:catechol 2,3-dioxygenase-like lactoylglutathione lyase family enzyme
MITGVHHTGLVVRDLDAAIAFFATGNAFRVLSRFAVSDDPTSRALLQVEDATAKAALLQGTLGCLELFEFAATRSAPLAMAQVPASGIRHVCLQTAINDDLFDAMLGAGASAHARPSGLGTGNSYAYIRDPEGNLLELEGVPWAPAVTRPWYAHTALVSPDIARITAFYEMLTGVAVHSRGRFGPDVKFDTVAGIEGVRFDGAWLRLSNAEIEFWQYYEPASLPAPRRDMAAPGWNHLCFESNDIAADYDRLLAAGVELHGPPADMGGARVLFGRDPDGNVFELLQPAATGARASCAAMLDESEGKAIDEARTAMRATQV